MSARTQLNTPPHNPQNSEDILDNQRIRLKRGRVNRDGYERAWNAYFDFYLSSKYMKEPLLQLEDVTFHLYLLKNLNDDDPHWRMPSFPMMKKHFGIGQTKIEMMIKRLERAHLLEKVSGKKTERGRGANVSNEYVLSDPIPTIDEFLAVAAAEHFKYIVLEKQEGKEVETEYGILRDEWKARWEQTIAANISGEIGHNRYPLPILGKAPLPDIGNPPLPKMGKHKQTSKNKQTAIQEQTMTANSGNGQAPSETLEHAAAVLIEKGFSKRMAQKLVQQAKQSRVDIVEKVAYLDFLLAQQPDKIKKPLGWLRRAIEENFAAPQGYKPKAQLEAEEAEKQRQAAEIAQHLQAAQELQLLHRQNQQQEHEERLEQLRQQFGTTEREYSLWNTIKSALQLSLPLGSYLTFVDNTELLSLANGQAIIGVPHSTGKDWLDRQLSREIKRQLNIELRLVSETKEKVESVSFVTMN